MLNLENIGGVGCYSVPGASLAHLSQFFVFQFLFIVFADYKRTPNGYLFFIPLSVLFHLFQSERLLNTLCILFLPVCLLAN